MMSWCRTIVLVAVLHRTGFNLTFMTGFGVSATYGVPDTGLVSAAEMYHSASVICGVLKQIPCIGDGDTVMKNSGYITNIQLLKQFSKGLRKSIECQKNC